MLATQIESISNPLLNCSSNWFRFLLWNNSIFRDDSIILLIHASDQTNIRSVNSIHYCNRLWLMRNCSLLCTITAWISSTWDTRTSFGKIPIRVCSPQLAFMCMVWWCPCTAGGFLWSILTDIFPSMPGIVIHIGTYIRTAQVTFVCIAPRI